MDNKTLWEQSIRLLNRAERDFYYRIKAEFTSSNTGKIKKHVTYSMYRATGIKQYKVKMILKCDCEVTSKDLQLMFENEKKFREIYQAEREKCLKEQKDKLQNDRGSRWLKEFVGQFDKNQLNAIVRYISTITGRKNPSIKRSLLVPKISKDLVDVFKKNEENLLEISKKTKPGKRPKKVIVLASEEDDKWAREFWQEMKLGGRLAYGISDFLSVKTGKPVHAILQQIYTTNLPEWFTDLLKNNEKEIRKIKEQSVSKSRLFNENYMLVYKATESHWHKSYDDVVKETGLTYEQVKFWVMVKFNTLGSGARFS